MSKFIYAASLGAFKIAFPNYATPTDPSYRSVVYTGDGYIVTHGKTMKANVTGDTENPYGLAYTLSGQKAEVTVAGVSKSITLPVIGAKTTTTDALTTSISGGIVDIKHNLGNASWTGNQTVGPTDASNSAISVPQIVFDKYGHYKSVSLKTATLNQVKQSVNADANTKYLLFGTSATTTTAETQFSTAIKAVASTGALYAKIFNQNGKTLDATYAPISHASTGSSYGLGTSANYGHVKLSDSNASDSDVNSGVAATPKSVKTALTSAKSYAEGLFASNDAMIFVGTINAATGVIVTVNNLIGTKHNIVAGTTKIGDLTSYSAGWTFRVATAGTITGIGVLEVGDMITCVSDYATAYKATDWTAIQTNIDGAVTAANLLAADSVVLGNSNKAVKTLTNGSNGQVLKIVSGKPVWTTDNTTRAINVDGAAFLASNTATALDLCGGTSIKLGVDKATGKVTISSTALVSGNINALNFLNGGTSVLSYNPVTAAMSVNFTSGLKASNSSGVLTVGHINTTSAQSTSAVRSFTYDSHGHITGSSVVESLKNPNAFTFGISGTTDTYDGSAAKTFVLKGSGATSVAISSGIVTISSQDTHHTAYLRACTSTGTSNAATTNGNTYLNLIENSTLRSGVNIVGVGATTVVSDANGKVTISSSNTWRDIQAYGTSGNLASIGQNILKFKSSFGWSNNELDIMWAEIDADGAITYAV